VHVKIGKYILSIFKKIIFRNKEILNFRITMFLFIDATKLYKMRIFNAMN